MLWCSPQPWQGCLTAPMQSQAALHALQLLVKAWPGNWWHIFAQGGAQLPSETLILRERAGSSDMGSFALSLISIWVLWDLYQLFKFYIKDCSLYWERSFWFPPCSPLNLFCNPLAPLMKFLVVCIVIKPLFGEYHFNPHYMSSIGIKYSLCNYS